MIEYLVKNEPKEVEEYCQLAADNDLYVPGWTLFDWYLTEGWVKCISLAKDSVFGYVGAAALSKENDVSVFVKTDFRRKGIGTNLLALLTKDYDEVFGIDYCPWKNKNINQAFFQKSMSHKKVRDCHTLRPIWSPR